MFSVSFECTWGLAEAGGAMVEPKDPNQPLAEQRCLCSLSVTLWRSFILANLEVVTNRASNLLLLSAFL